VCEVNVFFLSKEEEEEEGIGALSKIFLFFEFYTKVFKKQITCIVNRIKKKGGETAAGARLIMSDATPNTYILFTFYYNS